LIEETLNEIEMIVTRNEAADDQAAVANNSTPVALTKMAAVDNVLLRLPDLINQTLIDQAAVDFCLAQYSCKRLARAKLVETMVEVPRYRLDLLPYYSRFIATLHPHMPDVSGTVLATMVSQFKRLFRKQHPIDLQNRVKNIRFLGELAKFKVSRASLFHVY
jgi:regulator of nonsense transcripts 2